jgi:hypothetical protein
VTGVKPMNGMAPDEPDVMDVVAVNGRDGLEAIVAVVFGLAADGPPVGATDVGVCDDMTVMVSSRVMVVCVCLACRMRA